MSNNQRIGFNCPASTSNPIDIFLNREISGSNSVTIKYWDAENDDEPTENIVSITHGDNEGTEFSNQSPVCSGDDLEINAEYEPSPHYEFYRKTQGDTTVDIFYYDATDGGRRKKLRIQAGKKKPSK
tara:strand:+ start:244 stop:624 length:381 start_codon:yes stop_codon:yes gene_type:complete